MKSKPTDELMNLLINSNSAQEYVDENEEFMANDKLCEYLTELVETKKLKKSEVIRKAELNEIYGYQLFSGIRHPSRDTLISLCVGMNLEVDEVQNILKVTGYAPLYPKIARDSAILFGIANKHSVCDINEALYVMGEKNLGQ